MIKTVSQKNLNQIGNKTVPTKMCLSRSVAPENLRLPKIPSSSYYYFFLFFYIINFLLKTKLKGHNL